MKKFAIALFALISILAVVLFLKMNGYIPSNEKIISKSSSSYSNEEIKALILKGKDNLHNMENVYYEKCNADYLLFNKFYFKEGKTKRELYNPLPPNEILRIVIEIGGKEYDISYLYHNMHISNKSSNKVYYGFQNDAIDYASTSVVEFTYLKDEKFDDKDCILVRATYHGTSEDFKSLLESNGEPTYWIEKSTGFVIGDGRIKSGENTPTLETIYRNISFGTVQDNEFEIPTDYSIR